MNLQDLMIDEETMGLPPDGALLSIGACFFDVATETIGAKFHRTINLATAVRDGGTLEPSTILWWLGQSDRARSTVMHDGIDIRKVLTEFSDFVTENCPDGNVRPWGNGSTFDLTILSGAYKRSGIPLPWHWSKERCFRTVRNMYPQVTYDPADKGEGAHNALADAVFQAEHMFKIKRAVAAARAQ